MEGGLLTTHGKKLLMIGLFLGIVAVMIGGEDNPGLIAQQVDAPGNGVASALPYEPARQGDMKVTHGPPPTFRPNKQDNAALDAWYAASDTEGDWGPGPEPQAPQPMEPRPVDESHLINDTQPLVVAAPEVR